MRTHVRDGVIERATRPLVVVREFAARDAR
jgi:hypothetical protein